MNRYITTTLPYVNADPHVGHALEFVQADVLARTGRLKGMQVFFNMGTDEHGQKIWEAAQKAGQDPQSFADHYSEEFKKLIAALNLSNDAFVRTTDPKHREAAQEMWRRCNAAGDIYKKSYEGLYCVGCESYKTDKDIIDERCVLHPNLELTRIEEENYFFRFGKYADRLRTYLSSGSVLLPESHRNEMLNFIDAGLEDFSISREASRLPWGIPVPDDETQVMYVWFDALTNYISTLGWPQEAENFKTFWEEGTVIQVAGKDQTRFQSLMWQAMLMSAGIKNSDHIFIHGFITSDGAKMSKSLGNVINPYELVAKYGTDATRYLFLRHVHPFEDSDMTWERLDEWYTADLVNGIGNLVARVMKLAEDNLFPVVLNDDDIRVESTFTELVDRFEFQKAAELVMEHVAKGDEFMTTNEPYKKIKDEATKAEALAAIEKLVRHIAKIAAHLAPLMPQTSATILASVGSNTKPENLFPRLAAA